MAVEEGKDKKVANKPITEAQRFRYIGFEVFPGKPKDLFKSDKEKAKYVDGVVAKRTKGDVLRDQCTLLEQRVSMTDRLVLTIASIIIFATLFIPWYSAYNEIVVETTQPVQTEQAPVVADSAMLAQTGDSLAAQTTTQPATESIAGAAGEQTAGTTPPTTTAQSAGSNEEVITGYVAKKKVNKEYERLTGIGSFLALGSVASYAFSSGFAVAVSVIVFLIYTLLCIALPVYTLYGLYGLKGDPDKKALQLKKMLRFNWIPLILFFVAMILSFFGSEYGFDAANMFTSLGDGYGPGVFLNVLSWGIIVSLGAFILVAVKGVEI